MNRPNRPDRRAGPTRRTVLGTGLAAALTTATACTTTNDDAKPATTPTATAAPPPPSPFTSGSTPSSPTDWPALTRSIDGPLVRPDDAAYATARQLYNTRFDGLKAYQNYTDPDLTDWRKAYYGTAENRLTRLKKQYDPGRLFTFPQAL